MLMVSLLCNSPLIPAHVRNMAGPGASSIIHLATEGWESREASVLDAELLDFFFSRAAAVNV